MSSLFAIFFSFLMAFMISMFMDCILDEPNQKESKFCWCLILFFFNVFGALYYFFSRYLKRHNLIVEVEKVFSSDQGRLIVFLLISFSLIFFFLSILYPLPEILLLILSFSCLFTGWILLTKSVT